ncbi:GTP pyrophosphokinase [Pseudomonas oryzihabitans]|uniref:GTP pyrophosphokinase n=1 Tax=Pseudomonas oryzihabitans TaxID=47885 RepID=UPI001643C0A9|nr:hypothetical protein [Pseudomonas oryzihabitans]
MDQAVSINNQLEIMSDYSAKRPLYQHLCKVVSDLLSALLVANGIEVHTISTRCKESLSLERKIKSKAKYSGLDEITDLAGIRVITHYNDDVNRVAEVLDREFCVDYENTVDKRRATEPDRFGYVSLHYVASLSETRAGLQEYISIGSLKFEIQVRSILQHTWAEIEHDTGYKVEKEVPAQIRRRFSRLAGLLELADEEFVAIRDALLNYSQEVVETINSDDPDVSLDKISLQAFFDRNTISKAFDEEICAAVGFELVSREYDNGPVLQRLNFFQIYTVASLVKSLKDFHSEILNLGIDMVAISSIPEKNLVHGSGSFYLCHLLAAKASAEVRQKYLEDNGWAEDNMHTIPFKKVLMKYTV